MADNSSGYFGVNLKPGRPKPYQARVKRDGKEVYLGTFATAEEAASCASPAIAGGAGGGGESRHSSPNLCRTTRTPLRSTARTAGHFRFGDIFYMTLSPLG